MPATSAASTRATSIALDAGGPWAEAGPVPWRSRASAALPSNPDGTLAIFASGLAFSGGVPSVPVHGDVRAVDASVCLLHPNGAVCGGRGAPDLGAVTCACDPGYEGRACERAAASRA